MPNAPLASASGKEPHSLILRILDMNGGHIKRERDTQVFQITCSLSDECSMLQFIKTLFDYLKLQV